MGSNGIKSAVVYIVQKWIFFDFLQAFEDIPIQENSADYTNNEKLSDLEKCFLLVETFNSELQGKSFPICK